MSVATKKPVSARKLSANRANARKSTGPGSAAGKARSSQNAISHGLFCRAAVLPGESDLQFHKLRADFALSLNPQDPVEMMLVDRIVLATWKLRRLQDSEMVLDHTDRHDMMNPAPELGRYDYETDADRDHHVALLEQFGQVKSEFDDANPMPASVVLAGQIGRDDEGRFERISRHEQRLENQILRMMRELRQMRKHREKEEPRETSQETESAVRQCAELVHQRLREQAELEASRASGKAHRDRDVDRRPARTNPDASAQRDVSKMKNKATDEHVRFDEERKIARTRAFPSFDSDPCDVPDTDNRRESGDAREAGESGSRG